MSFINFIYYIITSIVIVICSHFIYNYLRDTYTTKRIRYLGQSQNEKYLEIINELKKKCQENHENYVIKENHISEEKQENYISEETQEKQKEMETEDDMQQSLINFIKEYKA
jgi:CRISPR/Cas system CSM-associated protein Csm4 (group 5 of RAMP superfamily)